MSTEAPEPLASIRGKAHLRYHLGQLGVQLPDWLYMGATTIQMERFLEVARWARERVLAESIPTPAPAADPIPLTWRKGDFQMEGQRAGVTFFTIGYRLISSRPKWRMFSALPGLNHTNRIWEHDDQDWLKHLAEELTGSWLAAMMEGGKDDAQAATEATEAAEGPA